MWKFLCFLVAIMAVVIIVSKVSSDSPTQKSGETPIRADILKYYN